MHFISIQKLIVSVVICRELQSLKVSFSVCDFISRKVYTKKDYHIIHTSI